MKIAESCGIAPNRAKMPPSGGWSLLPALLLALGLIWGPGLAFAATADDTDGDGVNDDVDAFPNDRHEWRDRDGDGVGHNVDANDNDASVTWTRYGVNMGWDATVAANLIATFDDTTDDLAAMRAKPDKYTLTGVFVNRELDEWTYWDDPTGHPFEYKYPSSARVGDATVSTYVRSGDSASTSYVGSVGSIKIKGVTIRNDYLNFLMAGGGGSADVGLRIFAAGTSTVLVNRQSNRCHLDFLNKGAWFVHIQLEDDWWHIDVSALKGRSVDIEIYDDDTESRCGYLEVDHIYQSDHSWGQAAVALALLSPDPDTDTDGDGLTDVAEVDTYNTDPNDADTDSDSLSDGAEVNTHGTNPLLADTDGDNLNDGAELDSTPATNPLLADTDGDSLSDGAEVNTHGTNPLLADTDGDNLNDGAELDSTPATNPLLADTDGDSLSDGAEVNIHRTNPLLADTDGDNLNDGAELDSTPATNPLLADTDGDGRNDDKDAFPTNSNEWLDEDGDGVGHNTDADDNDPSITVALQVVDTDGDGVGHNTDANDNDASVTWTRYRVTLTPDATVAANLIATFDDTTDDIAAIQANTTKYTLTGMFASPFFANNWNVEYGNHAALVGDASVSTIAYLVEGFSATRYYGSIKVNGVTIKGDYLNFLMAGGGGSTKVGLRIFAAGTSTMLVNRQPNGCYLDSLNGFVIPYISDDDDWWHIDVSALKGQSVDIEIYDDDDEYDPRSHCSFVAFDHLYQSDSPRGSAAIALPLVDMGTDTDGDGVNDYIDAFPNNRYESRDRDGDGVGHNVDANDNDASVTWTRYEVTLPPTATVAANLIATFDDTTDDLAAMRANPDKYTLTGVFANRELDEWTYRDDPTGHPFEGDYDGARLGDASVSTAVLANGRAPASYVGSIKIKGVTIKEDYLNFLMAGGGGSADVGLRIFAAGTSTMLVNRQANRCYKDGPLDYHPRIQRYGDWWYIDVSVLRGQSVDIEIYDDDDTKNICGFFEVDHIYQSDNSWGEEAVVPGQEPSPDTDTDGDGLRNVDEVDTYNTDPNDADTDGDGLSDGAEVNTHGTKALLADTDDSPPMVPR